MTKKRLVVIGGGAAGFFCAVNAAGMNGALEVILLEKTGKLLSKVKVSGGGRCNVTHACSGIAEMAGHYPRGAAFLKKAFHHHFVQDTVAWFSSRQVRLKTEADGRMFPETNSSQTIIDCLLQEASLNGIQVRLNADVADVQPLAGKWNILLKNGGELAADFVCVATGGHGKTRHFDWLRRLGHSIVEPAPSLFTFNLPNDPVTSLMGVTIENVQVKLPGSKLAEEGPLLITHWGLSGPAVLKLSAWAARELAGMNWHFKISVNWVPPFHEQGMKERIQQLRFDLAAQKIVNRNPFLLPQRFWEYLLGQSGINLQLRWADLPAKEQNRLVKNLCAQEFSIAGKTTFKEEFVTAGGIELAEVNHNTLESRVLPHLYFAGEVLNIDGVTGGFNFQNAWTTGWIAAKAVALAAQG